MEGGIENDFWGSRVVVSLISSVPATPGDRSGPSIIGHRGTL